MLGRITSLFALLPAVLAAPPEQIHIAYTGKAGQLSVDFVSSISGAAAYTSRDKVTWTGVAASSLRVATIGYLSQALLDFTGIAPGAEAYYIVSGGGTNSSVYAVTPIVARPEVFAVFGDFGYVRWVSTFSAHALRLMRVFTL